MKKQFVLVTKDLIDETISDLKTLSVYSGRSSEYQHKLEVLRDIDIEARVMERMALLDPDYKKPQRGGRVDLAVKQLQIRIAQFDKIDGFLGIRSCRSVRHK